MSVKADALPLFDLRWLDMCDHFGQFLVDGAQLNEAKLTENIERSVMMVTALSPAMGYDQASAIRHRPQPQLDGGRTGERRH